MPTVLKKIEDFANNLAPSYINTHVIPRGVPRFVDPSLKGSLRFSRRIGNTLPTIQPQNRVTLTKNVGVQKTILNVNSILSGYEPGSLIRINSQEVLLIKDVDPSLLLITLDTELLVNHFVGDFVDLYGVPVYAYGPAFSSFPSFYVRSSYKIYTGDQFYITQDPALIMSGTTYSVTAAVPAGTVGNDYLTYVTIDNNLPRDLALNDVLYLRAFPGYRSNKVIIPMHRRKPMYLGPFVVDYVSGRFDDGDVIEEFLDIQAYGASGGVDSPLLGTPPMVTNETYFIRSYKNFPILKVPIHPSSFMFWNCIRGKINYMPDAFIMTTDNDGKAVIAVDLIPPWQGTQTWNCSVQGINAAQGTIYYKFHPNNETVAGQVSMTASTNLTFTTGPQTATRAEITFVGQPNSSIKWSAWVPSDAIISRLEYTLVSRVTGNNIWQAGSLMIKPYFNVIADIEGMHDFDTFNSGSVMF